jgi:hypothetical protein
MVTIMVELALYMVNFDMGIHLCIIATPPFLMMDLVLLIWVLLELNEWREGSVGKCKSLRGGH